MENPFDNHGLDFGAVKDYLSRPQSHSPNNEYEHSISLNIDPEESDPSRSTKPQSSKRNEIIFVAGYPTPEQVGRLTREYKINPEVWRRHLATPFQTIEDTRLPSASCNIIQLRFRTIASWINVFNRHQPKLQSMRKEAEAEMKRYLEGLTTLESWRTGDSVVRNYEIHDRGYFSIEQIVTIYIQTVSEEENEGNGPHWNVLICSDCGRDLAESPTGPWLGERPNEAGFHIQTFPVPEHHVWSAYSNVMLANSTAQPQPPLEAIPQSLGNLFKVYKAGQSLGIENDYPISAIYRVFQFFVATEGYALSFIAHQISQQISHDKMRPDLADNEALANLLHFQKLLERHIDELRDALRIVTIWKSPDCSAGDIATTLVRDLEYLIERASTLKTRAETSITLSMSITSINEARRSVQLNNLVSRFTVIASIYVPLSFVATIFGMNFRQLGQGNLSIWIYFAVSIPVFIMSALVLFVNPQAVWLLLQHLVLKRT